MPELAEFEPAEEEQSSSKVGPEKAPDNSEIHDSWQLDQEAADDGFGIRKAIDKIKHGESVFPQEFSKEALLKAARREFEGALADYDTELNVEITTLGRYLEQNDPTTYNEAVQNAFAAQVAMGSSTRNLLVRFGSFGYINEVHEQLGKPEMRSMVELGCLEAYRRGDFETGTYYRSEAVPDQEKLLEAMTEGIVTTIKTYEPYNSNLSVASKAVREIRDYSPEKLQVIMEALAESIEQKRMLLGTVGSGLGVSMSELKSDPGIREAIKKGIEKGLVPGDISALTGINYILGDEAQSVLRTPEIQDQASSYYAHARLFREFEGDTERAISEHIYNDQPELQRTALVKELPKLIDDHLEEMLKKPDRIPDSIIEQAGFEHFVQYRKDLGYPSAELYKRYEAYADLGDPVKLEGFVRTIKQLGESFGTSKPIPDSILENEFYRPTVEALFPNNAQRSSNYESNESCKDRSRDLEKYQFEEMYKLDLTAGKKLQLRTGKTEDIELESRLEAPFKMSEETPVATQSELRRQLASALLESLSGKQTPEDVRQSFLAFENSHQNLNKQLENLKKSAKDAKNPRVAYLQSLRELYGDHLKDRSRELVDFMTSDPEISQQLPGYFQRARNFRVASAESEKIASLRPEKAGLTDPFLRQILSTLEKSGGKKHFSLYERDSNGELKLDENGEPILGSKGKALRGIIEKQATRIADLSEAVGGERPDLADVHIGRFSLEELLKANHEFELGEYDPELFKNYIEASLQGIFQSQVDQIDAELSKYEVVGSSSERARIKQINAYFSKNKVAAHSRAVGGVCVSGDNPIRGSENLWDMPNYFQLILQDSDTKQAQGLVLLHEITDDGRKILSAAYNPSSTLLYKVDETAMFDELTRILASFAKENQFDAIALSQNEQIRTNRTGGEFERTLKDRIAKVDRQIELNEDHRFSFKPEYFMSGKLDVIWDRESDIASTEANQT